MGDPQGGLARSGGAPQAGAHARRGRTGRAPQAGAHTRRARSGGALEVGHELKYISRARLLKVPLSHVHQYGVPDVYKRLNCAFKISRVDGFDHRIKR